jgi:uncharacterized iron-regulated protein
MMCVRILLSGLVCFLAACTTAPKKPSAPHALLGRELWIDLVTGDEASDSDVFSDLATAGVVYVGEYHAIPRHHEIQFWLFQELFRRGQPMVLCLEQLEAPDQPAIDRYGRREIDFATLVKEIDWAKKWRNYESYRQLCEFARQHRIPIRALNASVDLIRSVSRGGGVAKLSAEQRAKLPTDIMLDDPAYERLLNLELAVHAGMDPAKLRPVFEAQVARDETMAANIVAGRRADGAAEPRIAFVVLGAAHMRFGLGTAARVRRREPGIVERLVLVSESGQLQLSAAEKAGQREVTISHAEFRAITRPPADYLRVLPLLPALPAGHPPIPQ